VDAEKERLALVREEGARYGSQSARRALAQLDLEPDIAIGRVVLSLREAAARLAAEPDLRFVPDLPTAWLSGALQAIEVEVRAHFDGLRRGEPEGQSDSTTTEASGVALAAIFIVVAALASWWIGKASTQVRAARA